jgi:hypothetical protein
MIAVEKKYWFYDETNKVYFSHNYSLLNRKETANS